MNVNAIQVSHVDIKQSLSGQIIKSSRGYSAFVPNNLPPAMQWDKALVSSLSRANFLLGNLAHEGSKLANHKVQPFIAREAVLSSKIEGTQTTLEEILAATAGVLPAQNPDDLAEVQNYIKALDYGIRRLEELPLSLRLIKEIHGQLMQGAGSHARPGEFRTSQNWIGPPGCTLTTAKFVPPPPEQLMDCLSDFERFLHNRQLPPLIHIALCHYQFEAIHPFLDGNGRIGRLLIMLLLIEQKLLPLPILHLSVFFEATRDEYYKQLYNVSHKATWNEWLIYFLNAVAVQSEDLLSRADRINVLISKWKIKAANSSIAIIELLAVNPFFTIRKLAEKLKIAYSTAQRSTQKLESLGIIKQTSENKRDRVYCATGILKILVEPIKLRADCSE